MSKRAGQTRQFAWQHWRIVLCRVLLGIFGFLWLSIIVELAINLYSSWLFSPLGTDLAKTNLGPILDWMKHHVIWVAPALVILGLLIILAWRGGRVPSQPGQKQTQYAHSIAPEQIAKARVGLINGLLCEYQQRKANSLQGRTMMSLDLHEHSHLVRASGQLVFQRLQSAEEHPLPPGTSILEVYELTERGLLILGAPGAGKSTLLLDLACKLLRRARTDAEHPVPLILNLSSWGIKRLPLEQWLVEQVKLAYSVQIPLSQTLLLSHQWLLLLDGLDEVEASARAACIKAINTYHDQHLTPLVVCSRQRDYVEQQVRLVLPMAVEVQPLTPPHVLDYLKRGGKAMSAVHTVLQKNAVFHELIRTPLMLSVVLLTYEGKTVKDLPQMGSTEEQQRQVFAHYVERMLERLTRRSNFTPLQTGQWLTWLAQQMQQRHLTEFYLEYLQPAWLPEPFQSIYGVLFYLYVPVVVLLFELLVGLASGIVVKPDGSGMVFYLIIGLAIFCLVDLSPLMTKADANLEIFPVFPLKAAFLRLPSQDRWCWLLFVLIHVLLVGLFFGWGFGMHAGIFSGLLFFGLCVGSLLFIEGGSDLSEVQINERQCNKPNQAIQYSGWSALCIGCGAGLFVMLMSVLLSNGYGNLDLYSIGVLHWKGLRQGLFFGLAGLLFFGQWFGGRAYLQHHTLRFLLWLSGAMPWRSVRFLEEGTEHMLLQRVGGCYRFIHPLFQEYFASLDVTTSTQQTDLPTEQTPESQEQDNPTKRP